ncbi:sensor histidine kinase [Modestobacter sp. VKM Ac-2986]|uniref:sensor histidine kinase n=1 Tax=Modestobacter sp. VKM Ac-2986 TaxID=3004140 RepID=UPI0022AA99D4|nr:sensor histidine kinase [Modestobacter sp. VKM Ac-2986]MCZ2827489.1 sensor histidine kinase [Modestobacter sp. VKM Ac-2986]
MHPPAPPGRRPGRGSLARQLLLLQASVVLVVVVVASGVAYGSARTAVREAAEAEVLGIVESLINSPFVRTAVSGPDATALLEPYVEQIRADTGTSFITVLAPDRTRYTHPDPSQIGRPFLGTIAPALAGRTFTETYSGTLGPSVRATGPVLDERGQVVALVSAGITVTTIGDDLQGALPGIAWTALATLAVGGLGSWAISRRLRRQTHGLGAAPLARMLEYYDAVLHAVREGLLLVDGDCRVQLVNDEARRLLDLPEDLTGRHVTDLGLPAGLTDVLTGQRLTVDAVQVTRSRVLVVNQAPARQAGRTVGTVVTLRDHTDLQALTGELDSVRAFAHSLRAQSHEAANRLHTTISLVELGRTEEAIEFATTELAVAQRLTDEVVAAVDEPVLAALLLGKAAAAHERGVSLVVDPDSAVGSTGLPGGDLVTVVGNLLDNAVDAALEGPPPREVHLLLEATGAALEVRVEDTGPGLTADQARRVFDQGWTTKQAPAGAPAGLGRGLGLALVAQTVRRHGGTIEVRPGPGAEFTVTVPLPSPATAR